MRSGARAARGAALFSILMIEITAKIKPGTGAQISGQLRLSYDLRQKRWLRARWCRAKRWR